MRVPEYSGNLRANFIHIPKEIEEANGIRIFGRLIKSIIFTTDVAIIRNSNADAVIAVTRLHHNPSLLMPSSWVQMYPSLLELAELRGSRVLSLAIDAEQQGAMGVVLNSPPNELIASLKQNWKFQSLITIASEHADIKEDSIMERPF